MYRILGTTLSRAALCAGLGVSAGVLAIPTSPAVAATVKATALPVAASTSRANSLQSDALRAISLLGELKVAAGGDARSELGIIRDRLATIAAQSIGADQVALRAAWRRADDEHLTALMRGITQIGVPYRRNQSNPGRGFDCSGLTSYAWRGAGYDLARQSGSQINSAAKRTRETAQAGDLVYYPGHVMLWLGVDNYILHSPYTGQRVRFDDTSSKRLRFGDPTG